MTQPRSVVAGMVVMVTRRTVRRTQLLRPDPTVRQLYLYCLAAMAQRHAIRVHAVTLMSTHEHLIVTDTQGRLPLFLRELHRLVALGIKVLRKWEGAVWDHERPSVVHLCTPQAVVEKLAYVMANPVSAGLVRHAKDWPGLCTQPHELGSARLGVKRPEGYLNPNNPEWPEQHTLELQLPEVEGLNADELRETVQQQLDELEQQACVNVRAKGWQVLGAKHCRTASPYARARSWEPVRGRNPAFAVGRGQRKAFFEAVAALRAFRRAYREALTCWCFGVRSVIFPAGTWLMRWLHGAAVLSKT